MYDRKYPYIRLNVQKPNLSFNIGFYQLSSQYYMILMLYGILTQYVNYSQIFSIRPLLTENIWPVIAGINKMNDGSETFLVPYKIIADSEHVLY